MKGTMLTLLEINALEQRLLTSKLLPPLKMEASSQRWRNSRYSDDMEAEIWSELPNHLVYKVLALLPFRDFVRLQWVCRRWSRLVDSQSFLDEFSQGPPENPWFAIVGDARKVYVYVPYAERWYTMPTTFLPPNSVYLASDKGLILYRVSQRASGLQDLLVVHNPFVTNSRRVLPWPTLYGCSYTMEVDEATKTYNIYHFGQLQLDVLDGSVTNTNHNNNNSSGAGVEDDHAIEVLSVVIANRGVTGTTTMPPSSSPLSWQVLGRENPQIFAGLPPYAFDDARILVWDDYVFCRLRGYFGVFAYSLTNRNWMRIPWPVRPNITAFQQLICSHNQLIMVVGMKDDGVSGSDSGCKSIQLRGLCRGSLQWTDMGRVPNNMNQMRYNFDSYSRGDFVFMLYATKLLVHNVATGAWSFAPPCHHVCENFQEFCFEPRLNMVA